jgi:hypothetical protein
MAKKESWWYPQLRPCSTCRWARARARVRITVTNAGGKKAEVLGAQTVH